MEILAGTDSLEHRFETLHRIGIALSRERDRARLVESILLEAKRLCGADGGTLYLVRDRALHFAMLHTDSLGIAQGGTTGVDPELPPLPLFDLAGQPSAASVATRSYHERRPIHVADAYAEEAFNDAGFRVFDRSHRYRSISLLAVPLLDSGERVVAVLQLVNAGFQEPGGPYAFEPELQRTVEALAAQAGIALENQALLAEQRELLDAFIRILAEAIDEKSPYTGRHCERVPVLMELMMRSLCEVETGPYAHFQLGADEWRELRVAAWLHDCGKVTTPVHVMDKATKLEGIFDRLDIVRERFEVLRREAELNALRARVRGEAAVAVEAGLEAELRALDDDFAFLQRVNAGSEWMSDEEVDRVAAIARRPYRSGDHGGSLLEPQWVEHLSVRRGTLTAAERRIINGHMVQTLRMLQSLPFPETLGRVVEYACNHHERMDGAGYPRGIFAGDLSIPARVMAIADVFEALTASDRPYKPGKPLSECAHILARMKEDNHLDPDLLDHCARAGVFEEFARRFLEPQQLDAFDSERIVATRPKPFALPDEETRRSRQETLLPEYRS